MVLNRVAFVAIQSKRFVAVIVFLILVAGISATGFAQTIQIGTIEDLQKIGNDPVYPLNGSYVLTQDIDVSATAAWNGGAGFAPIGSRSPWTVPPGTPFTGQFDGQGHVISGLSINHTGGNDVGLFGYVGYGGQVKNVGLQGGAVSGPGAGGLVGENDGMVSGCYVTGKVSGGDYDGGLVAYNGGTVTQCYATGTVSGNGFIGGLVGCNDTGTVTQCYATGTVLGSGSAGDAGGLVGFNLGTVSQCYATGTVTGSSQSVGGLVGFNGGTVSQCYATGTVTYTHIRTDGYVGGLVGVNYGMMSACYATGMVSVSGYVTFGGLVGYDHGSVIDSSYWDTETSGQATSSGGTGETTAAMMTQATFAGWDFQNVWGIFEFHSYPYLLFEKPELQIKFAPSVTSGSPPLPVSFTYWASVPESFIYEWEWEFGDGAKSYEPNPSHVYTEFGFYPVSLTVITYDGVAVSTQQIVVGNGLPIRPESLFLLALAVMLAATFCLRRIAAADARHQ